VVYRQFNEGQEDVQDDLRSGHPNMRTDANVNGVRRRRLMLYLQRIKPEL
jgi:hypothetical protein